MPAQLTVTRPSFPALEDFEAILTEIWGSGVLTNGGARVRALEAALEACLGVKHVSLFCNGTVALQTALRVLAPNGGEVVTTPYSFPATAHAVVWAGCEPVFCDVDASTCCIDWRRMEALITERTVAILPVHVYGWPCDDTKIREIADTHGIPVVYDAAPAFGVLVNGAAVAGMGTVSMLSFHATKVFNTGEGGALVTDDDSLKAEIDLARNFGIVDESTVDGVGTNGKMSELNAAFGLALLPRMGVVISRRLEVDAGYRDRLAGTPGLGIPEPQPGVTANGAYFPVFIDTDAYGESRDSVYFRLMGTGIKCRRYYRPILNRLPAYRDCVCDVKISEQISETVLCLPIHEHMVDADIDRVCRELGGSGR